MKEQNKSILFVTPHYPPSPSVGTQRMIRFIKYLLKDGWHVYVLTLKTEYYANQKIISETDIPKHHLQVIRTSKLDIFRIWAKLKRRLGKNKASGSSLSTTGGTQHSIQAAQKNNLTSKNLNKKAQKRSMIFRFIDFITRMLQYPDQENGWFWNVLFYSYYLIRKHKIPIVFASSPPHSPYLALNFLHRILRFKYVVDFRDPWARSQWSKVTRELHEKIGRKLDIHFENKTLQCADAIIFNNQILFEEYLQAYSSFYLKRKSLVLTNGFDPDKVDIKKLYGARKTRSTNEIVIIHAGTLYKKRDPRSIFEALIQLKKERPSEANRIIFKFLGHITPDLSYLYTFVEAHQLNQQVYFLPALPYEEALQEMEKADWLLILQPVTRIQVPAKFFDYLMIPRPIWGVVEPESISERLINQINIGKISYNENIDSIIDFFHFILNNPGIEIAPHANVLKQFMVSNIVIRLENFLL